MASPFLIYGMYHIYWYVWIGLSFHHILPVLPPALDCVPALEGSDTDQDHISHLQRHCLAIFIIISYLVLCLLLLKQVSLSMGTSNAVPQFLDVLGGCGYSY